jgi:FixJ family two-component response regulator
MLRAIVEAMRRSTRRALLDARRLRRRRARAIRRRGAEDGVAEHEALHARVREVLEAHPSGIRAREIGNQLGIDWRSVTAVMSALVARGTADQIEQDFYPRGKASRKC